MNPESAWLEPDPKNDWSDKSTMNKIMEYMFFGLPAVAYDLTENMHSAGPAGTLVEGNSERGLADAISRLLDDPERRTEMSERGRTRVRERLAWEHSVPDLLSAYEKLFGRPAPDAAGSSVRQGR